MRIVCENVSPRQTGLFCRLCWNDSACLPPIHKLLSANRSLLLPVPNCFLRVFLPRTFGAVSKFILPLTTSPISGAANSNKSACTRFAAGTTYLRKNGLAVLLLSCARAPNPSHAIDQKPNRMECLAFRCF